MPSTSGTIRHLVAVAAALLLAAPAGAEFRTFTKTCIDVNGGQVCAGDWIRCTLHVEVVTNFETFTLFDFIRGDFYTQWRKVQPIPPPPAIDQSVLEGVPMSTVQSGRFQFANIYLDAGESLTAVYEMQVRANNFGAVKCQQASLRTIGLDVLNSNDSCVRYDCVPPNTPVTQVYKTWVGTDPSVGDPVRWELELVNLGTAADADVRVRDTIDASRFLAPTASYSRPPDLGGLTGHVLDATWTRLDAGESVMIAIDTVYASCAGTFPDGACNQAEVTGPNIQGIRSSDDPSTGSWQDPTCRSGTPGGTSSITAPPVKTLEDLDGRPLEADDVLRVRVRIENTGFCPELRMHFEDMLPSELDYVAGSAVVTPPSGLASWSSGSRTLSVDDFDVAARSTTEIAFDVRVVRVPGSGQVCNTARWRTDAGAFTPTTQACLDNRPDQLAARKSHDDPNGDGTVARGQTLVWSVDVENTGTIGITGASVTDTVPSCFDVVQVLDAAGGTPVVAGQDVTVTGIAIPAGTLPATVRIEVVENGSCPDLEVPCNSATVSSPLLATPQTAGPSCIEVRAAPTCPQLPGAIAPLLAAKAAPAAHFEWPQEPASDRGYRLYAVAVAADIPVADAGLGLVPECQTAAVGETACDDPDALDPAAAPLLFYQLVGVCADGSEGIH